MDQRQSAVPREVRERDGECGRFPLTRLLQKIALYEEDSGVRFHDLCKVVTSGPAGFFAASGWEDDGVFNGMPDDLLLVL